jgi:CHAT domain-containing protein/tetratricopeptide (TPR) repeat protein
MVVVAVTAMMSSNFFLAQAQPPSSQPAKSSTGSKGSQPSPVALFDEDATGKKLALNADVARLHAEGRYLEALEEADRRRVLVEKDRGPKHADYAMALLDLAGMHYALAEYQRAEPLYLEALSVLKDKLGEKDPIYARGLANLAGLYQQTGDPKRAEDLCRKALKIRKEVLGIKHLEYAASLFDLGSVYDDQGDYGGAISNYLDALKIREEILGTHSPLYAMTLNNLAASYKNDRKFGRAKLLYAEARDIQKEKLGTKHPHYATTLNNFGVLYRSVGEHELAEPLLIEALAIRREVLGTTHPDYAVSLNNLAAVYEIKGDRKRVESLLLESIATLRDSLGPQHPKYATGLENLAHWYALQHRPVDAEPRFREALVAYRKSLELAAVVQPEARQLAMTESIRSALDAYISMGLNDDSRRMESVPRDATSPSFARNIFDQVLSWKGATLVRQRGMRLAAADPAIGYLFERLQDSIELRAAHGRSLPVDKAKHVVWQNRLKELSDEKDQLEAEICDKSTAFRQATKEASLDDILSSLPPRAVLIDYLEFWRNKPPAKNGEAAVWQREVVAFVVRRTESSCDQVRMISLGPADALTKEVETWRQTYGLGDQASLAGRELRAKVWEPLLPAIGNAETILVAADGPLARLPLAGLPGRTPGTYLIEDYRLAMIPVPQLLPALVAAGADRQTEFDLLLVGDVDYDAEVPATASSIKSTVAEPNFTAHPSKVDVNDRFVKLPGTKLEIDSIRRLFGEAYSSHVRRIAGMAAGEATEARFRQLAPQSRYLHLATHGFFMPAESESTSARTDSSTSSTANNADLLSGLAMAGANRPPSAEGDDGILTAEEIACLPLGGARLVTLSACETGLGEAAGGEGLLGLQRAFQVSGARTTIASYWKVDDQATAALMALFYENLWKKEQSALDALRNAQLTLLRDASQIETAASRGPGQAKPLPGGASAADASKTASRLTDIRRWAAFTLSGDWR